MKKSFLSLVAVSLVLFFSASVVFATSFSDLTWIQKQKYWSIISTDCAPLLIAKNYTGYRTCALNALETAAKYQENVVSWCTDDDGGANFTQKGIVKTDIKPNGVADYIYTFPNGSTYLMEGMCSNTNKYYYIQKNCSELGSKYHPDVAAGACVYVNHAPKLMTVMEKTEINEGEYYEIYLYGTDEDGDNLTFSGENLPEGSIIDENAPVPPPVPAGTKHAVFSWTPTYQQAGEYEVTFVVSDGGSEDSINLVIIVGENPTYIGGIISEDTVLSKNGNPYIVTGNILVPEGIILTLEPGVEMRFDGPYYIKVEGTFVADGTESEKITFTSNEENPQPGDWGQIRFMDSSIDWDEVSGSIIRNAVLEYAGSSNYYPYRATLIIFNSSPLFDGNELRFGMGHGIYAEGCSSSFVNNIFHDSTSSGGYSTISLSGGTWSEGSSPLVKDNNFYNNSNEYIIMIGQMVNGAVVTGNQVSDNNGYGIFCNSCRKAEISYNYVSNNKFGIKASNASGQFLSSGDTLVVGNQLVGNSDTGLILSGVDSPANKLVVNNNLITANKISGVSVEFNVTMVDFVHNVVFKNSNGIRFYTVIGEFSSFDSNNIFDNVQYAVKVDVPKPDSWIPPVDIITLGNNWWGTTDTSVINEQIYDFYDDFDLPKAIYEPIATEPFEIGQ